MKPKEQIREALDYVMKHNDGLSMKAIGVGREALTLLDNCVVIPREDLEGMRIQDISTISMCEELKAQGHNALIDKLLEEYGE